MLQEIDVLKLVCQKLENAVISYMLTGSLAANFYAVPRMTRDIDIVVEVFESDVSKLLRLFQGEFYIDRGAVAEAIRHQSMFNIIHNDSVFKIDFVVRKESPYRITEFKRRRKIELDGVQIWIVAPEDLIISKLLWSKDSLSDFQLRDVRNLLLSAKNLDKAYIDQWVQTLDLKSVYDKVTVNE